LRLPITAAEGGELSENMEKTLGQRLSYTDE